MFEIERAVMTKKVLLGVVCFVALVTLAVILGTEAASFLQERRAVQERDRITEAVVREMGTLNIGDTLANFPLTDVETGDSVYLSELSKEGLLIVFAQTTCGMCDVQLRALQEILGKGLVGDRVAIIIGEGAAEAIEYERKYKLQCRFLYDESNQYRSKYKIMDSPFNLVLSNKGIISDLVVGRMTGSEMTERLESVN